MLAWNPPRPRWWPFLPSRVGEVALAAAAIILAFTSCWLCVRAVQTFGKQWTYAARVIKGHELITQGPYSVVRNPIYLGMFGLILSTCLAFYGWWSGLVVFLGLKNLANSQQDQKAPGSASELDHSPTTNDAIPAQCSLGKSRTGNFGAGSNFSGYAVYQDRLAQFPFFELATLSRGTPSRTIFCNLSQRHIGRVVRLKASRINAPHEECERDHCWKKCDHRDAYEREDILDS